MEDALGGDGFAMKLVAVVLLGMVCLWIGETIVGILYEIITRVIKRND